VCSRLRLALGRFLLALADRERGRSEHAHQQHASVPQQPGRDRAAVGKVVRDEERVQEENERTPPDRQFTVEEADALIGELEPSLERIREARQVVLEGGSAITDTAPSNGGGERGKEYWDALATLRRQPVDADAPRRSAASSSRVRRTARDPRVTGDEQHDRETPIVAPATRGNPRMVGVEQAGTDHDPANTSTGSDEAGRAFQDDGAEGVARGPGRARRGSRARRRPHRRREHVAHEHAGEVVVGQVATGTLLSNRRSTRCQRHADRTTPGRRPARPPPGSRTSGGGRRG
jgi:hypothetical protein